VTAFHALCQPLQELPGSELRFSFHLVDEEFGHAGTEALLCSGKLSEMNECRRKKGRGILVKKKRTPKHALDDVIRVIDM